MLRYLLFAFFLLMPFASYSVQSSGPASLDADGDGIEDELDPLPNDGNSSEDWDGDGIRDSIDLDDDNDQVVDLLDEDPFNQDQYISRLLIS